MLKLTLDWLIMIPTLLLVQLQIVMKLRKRGETKLKQILLSFCITLAGALLFMFYSAFDMIVDKLIEDEVFSNAVKICLLLPFSLFLWRGRCPSKSA